ncbi:MAG: hypothetical protein R8K20_09025 [Gallionellaceae bacterium]
MKNIYFYDKTSGSYVGMTNDGSACPDGCIASELEPSEYDGAEALDSLDATQTEQPETKQQAYAKKIESYSDRQLQAAMIRAKGFKHELLTAEKAKRES